MNNKGQNTVVINLFGTGCTVFRIRLSSLMVHKVNETAKKLGSPIEQAIFFADFFNELGEKRYRCVSDLSVSKYRGLLKDGNSHIEIRMNGRKKRDILVTDLLSKESLFPLYNIRYNNVSESLNSIWSVTEKELGLFSCFEVDTTRLDIDKLVFEFNNVDTGYERLELLSSLQYDGELLKSKSSDTLVSGNYAIIK